MCKFQLYLLILNSIIDKDKRVKTMMRIFIFYNVVELKCTILSRWKRDQ